MKKISERAQTIKNRYHELRDKAFLAGDIELFVKMLLAPMHGRKIKTKTVAKLFNLAQERYGKI